MRYNNLPPKDATVAAMKKCRAQLSGLLSYWLLYLFRLLYKQFALTIAVSVLISAFVALSLTPALCAGMLRHHKEGAERGRLQKFWDKFNDWFDRMIEIYGRSLEKMGRVIIAPIGVLIGLTVASVVMFVALPTAFLPEEDNGYFIGAISLPEGSVNIRTNAAIKEFLAYMGKDDAV